MKNFVKLFIFIILLTFCASPFIHYQIAYAATIKISNKSAIVIEGDYLYLEITGTKKKATWSSSNEYRASVSSEGKVTTKSTGKVNITAKIGTKKYTCKVLIIPNLDPDYMTDRDIEVALTEREYLDNFSEECIVIVTPTPTPTPVLDADSAKRINDMLKYDFASSEDLDTEIGKAYIEFCSTWVSEYELKETYGISTVWSWNDNKLYLIIDTKNKYIIEGTPDKFVNGTVYENNGIRYQYLEKFEYNGESSNKNQYYFSREDLIKIGIIKD